MEKNLTTGSVFGNIVRFSLPYLFSYFLQTLYGMADLFIIGQYADASGTTAVSVGSQVMHMLTLMIVGLAMGATVTIGQAVGARDQKSAARYTGNTMMLFLVLSVAVTGLLLALARPIAAVMSTPAEAVSGTVAYLRICFLGVPLITAYNIIASVFRGLGDSKRPMYFIAVACAVNIALDYLFIGALHMGPAGAALGTTLAQAVTDAAAVGIVEKIISFLFLVPSSMLSTVSALGAQCIGAGKPRRALQTLWYAIAVAFGFGVLISVVIQFVAEPVVALFTHDAAVAAAGGPYLRGYILDCCFAGVHFCFSGYFCAIGRSELSFLHNITAVVLVRVPGAYLTSRYFPATLLPMGLATAAGSLLSVIICVIAFLVLRRHGRLVPEED